MNSCKREALWCLTMTGLGVLGAATLLLVGHPVAATVLSFLAGTCAMAGLLDWIDA